MTTMLGPVSTWDDNGVGHSGTLPNDWYTSAELFELERRTFMREDLALRRVRPPGRRAGNVFRLHGRKRRSRRTVEPAMVSSVPCRTSACIAPAPWRSDPASAAHSSARTTAGCSSWTAACERRRGWRRPRASIRLASVCREFRVEQWGPSLWVTLEDTAPPLSEWLEDVTPRLRNYNVDQLRLRRRPPLDDPLQLEALRRQLHGGIPHPVHPSRARPESQPERLHVQARQLLERAVRRRAAPSRAGLARGRHPRRHAGVPPR